MAALWRRFSAVLRQRCPRCLRGPVFRSFVGMHERCPECGYVYEREEGYFLMAMINSYLMGFFVVAILVCVLVWLVFPESLMVALACGVLLYLPLAPLLFRYGRIIWLHMDAPRQ